MVTRTVTINVRTIGTNSINQLNTSLNRVNRSSGNVVGQLFSLSRVASAVISAIAIARLVQYSDTWTNLENRLRQVTNTNDELATSLQTVFNIAQSSRNSLQGVGQLYFRISQASGELGATSEQTAAIVESLANQLTASGLSAQETNSILLQTSQAFNSGRLNGDEFRAVSEALPAVLRSVAVELNRERSELNQLSEQGRITSDVLANALINTLEESRITIQNSTISISQGLTLIDNSVTRLIGTINNVTGVFDTAGGVLQNLSGVLDSVTNAIQSLSDGSVVLQSNGNGVLGLYDNLVVESNRYAQALFGVATASEAFDQVLEQTSNGVQGLIDTLAQGSQLIREYVIGLEEVNNTQAQAPQVQVDTLDVSPLTRQQQMFVDALRSRLQDENTLLTNNATLQIAIQQNVITQQEAAVRQQTATRLQELQRRQNSALERINEEQLAETGLLQQFNEQRALIEQEGLDRVQAIRDNFIQEQVTNVINGLELERQALIDAQQLDQEVLAGNISQQEAFEITARDRRLQRLEEERLQQIEVVGQQRAEELGLLQAFEDTKEQIVVNSEQRIAAARQQFALQQAGIILSSIGMLGQLNRRSEGLQRLAIVANTAAAVTRTLAAYPYPLNLVPASITAALGAAQLASVGSNSVAPVGSAGGGTGGTTASPGLTTASLTQDSLVPTQESFFRNQVLNELRNRDPDEPLSVDFTRRIMVALTENAAAGTA